MVAQAQVMTIGGYFAILRRRKWRFIIPFALVLFASTALAFLLPPIYRSEAIVLIERQEIPPDLVQTTVTGYVEERIEALTNRLLTRENLRSIIDKYNLYPEEESTEDRQENIKRMRDSILIEMTDVETSDPDKGKQSVATISFTVSFEAGSPQTAQEVTQELATLYLEGNRRDRTESAADVTRFLGGEAERLEKQIADLDTKLAEFKSENAEQLPELTDLNRSLYEKTESEIERTEEQIRTLQDSMKAMESELAITSPNREMVAGDGAHIMSPSDRLNALTAEYLTASVRYASNHPDLVKMRREIEALGGQVSGAAAGDIVQKLALTRGQLLEAQRNYTDNHPDVKKLKQSVMELEQALRTASATAASPGLSGSQVPADNPRYVSLKTQLDAAQGNLTAARSKLIQLNTKLVEYQERLQNTPAIEKEYKALTLDYENAKNRYQDLREKQLNARLAEQIESGGQAERFTIVQPAFLPTMPDKPSRLGIILLGSLIAFSLGLGNIAFAEYTDRTVHGSRDLIEIFNAPPLAVIPYIKD